MSNQITPNPSVPSQIVQEVKFPKFVNNLGIIPTSYKDSMSYYETLAWLCKYLEETVIPTLNQNGNAVEELQGLYVELNSYVTNYFDNLDVQEEINNKLDDMVQSGELQQLINLQYSELREEVNESINENYNSLYNMITSVSSGSPSGVYATVSALTTADPDHSKIYVVTETGNWYYYNTSSNEWISGGTYQGTSVADNSIYFNNLETNLQNEIKVQQIALSIAEEGKYISSAGTVGSNAGYNYTNDITLNENETLYIKCNAGSSVSVLASHNGALFESLVVGSNSDTTSTKIYSYSSTSKNKVVISYRNSVDISIYKTSINTNIKNKISESDKNILTNKSNINNNKLENYKSDISQYSVKDIRKKYSNNNNKINYPFVNDFIESFELFKSENRYNIEYNVEKNKNLGGTTFYVSKNGNNINTGLTKENPIKNFQAAINRASAGDTIEFIDEYATNEVLAGGTSITKSINLKGNGGYIFYGQQYEFTSDDALYSCPTSNITYVLNIKNLKNIWHYKKVNSLLTCKDTPYSYYLDSNTTLYINNGSEILNNNDIVVLRNYGHAPFTIAPSSNLSNIYIEGFNLFGSSAGCISNDNSINLDYTVTINKCIMQYASVNGISFNNNTNNDYRPKILVNECISKNNCKDGFNYGGKVTGVELNCIGNNNGLYPDHNNTNDIPNCNGSTAHQYSNVMRYNCLYFNNYGGNVADVQTNCKTISINCVAFDSLANTDNGYETDFVTQQAGVVMYLLNCNSVDSTTWKNIYVTEDSTMYVDDLTTYDSSEGSITPYDPLT